MDSELNEGEDRLNSEWLALNAVRELMHLASSGNVGKSTYQRAIELGGEILPEILGESSLIRAGQKSHVAREFEQRALLETRKTGNTVSAVSLLESEINTTKELVSVSKTREDADQVKRRLKRLEGAYIELNPVRLSENQAINRDVRLFDKELPQIGDGHAYADYSLVDDHTLRVRALHPDKAEAVLGADLIYERHSADTELVEVVMVQYKIWEDGRLYLKDERMWDQISKMRKATCDQKFCEAQDAEQAYRFPYCCSFLRPTDRLQSSSQSLRTVGEHVPICRINSLKSKGSHGADILKYEDIRSISLNHSEFESLFRSGKIGSRTLTYAELESLYKDVEAMRSTATVLIHGQNVQLVRDED